jgi:hypothetical protein
MRCAALAINNTMRDSGHGNNPREPPQRQQAAPRDPFRWPVPMNMWMLVLVLVLMVRVADPPDGPAARS